MKTLNRKTKSIGVFALALVMLVSMILPLTAGASGKQTDTYVVEKGDFNLWVAGDSASGEPVSFEVI